MFFPCSHFKRGGGLFNGTKAYQKGEIQRGVLCVHFASTSGEGCNALALLRGRVKFKTDFVESVDRARTAHAFVIRNSCRGGINQVLHGGGRGLGLGHEILPSATGKQSKRLALAGLPSEE